MWRIPIWTAVLLGAAAAAPGVSLTGLPDRLAFPLDGSANAVLTAEVSGGPVRQVWLATSEDAAGRVLLRRTGEGRWQLNLARPVVAAVLRAEGAGEFRVFAEGEDGEVGSSVPVRYSLREPPPEEPELTLYTEEPAGVARLVAWRERWVEPDRIARIEALGRLSEEPVARAGDVERRFAPAGDDGAFVLSPDDALVEAFARAGELRVVAGRRGFELRAIPGRLTFDENEAEFTVEQRRRGDVPGTRGWLEVDLGDISRGEVRLAVRTDDGTDLVPGRMVSAGDTVPIRLRGERVFLIVRRLENLLVGDDYAVLAIARKDVAGIESLLARIRGSDLVFIRNGEEFDGPGAAEYLAAKLAASEEPVRTREEFIERIATSSSTTGQPYLVEYPDGVRGPLAKWLRAGE